MSVTNYSVGDFLIQLKNCALAKKRNVIVRRTNFNHAVAQALKDAGYVSNVEEKEGNLFVDLKYHKKEPVLLNLKLVSSPGLRIYMDIDELSARRGPSTLLLSTPKGIFTLDKAIKARVGGEVIAEVF